MAITNRLFSFSNCFAKGQLVLPVGEVRQVDELSILRGSSIDCHAQHCDEITFAISGKATFISGDTPAELSAGQIHYIRAGVKHTIIANPESNFRYLCIGFNPNPDYAPIAALLPQIRKHPHFILEDDGRMKILTELLINEFYMWDEQSSTMANAYLVQILTTLLRILQGRSYDPSEHKLQKTASNFAIYHILRYIDREYLNISSIKTVAQQTSYSEYYISHLFSEKMGMTIKEYITRKKVLHAASLLLDNNISVTEAAEAVGFASAHAFRLAFKRYMQCSPTEYRRQPDSAPLE